MSTADSEWHTLALSKLCKILGDKQGAAQMQETLTAIGLPCLQTAADLKIFGERLKMKGGLIAVTGGLLSLQAVIQEHKTTRTT